MDGIVVCELVGFGRIVPVSLGGFGIVVTETWGPVVALDTEVGV